MRRFIATNELEKKEWLRYRKMGITGTDAGAICGLNPYVSAFQVYQDKITDNVEEGIFLQRATDTKKMMNVLTWEGVYTQPEISKKMIRGLLMLFSNEIFGRNIQDVFNEFPKIVEMSPKVEANSENE